MINHQVKHRLGIVTCVTGYLDIFPLEFRFYLYLNVGNIIFARYSVFTPEAISNHTHHLSKWAFIAK